MSDGMQVMVVMVSLFGPLLLVGAFSLGRWWRHETETSRDAAHWRKAKAEATWSIERGSTGTSRVERYYGIEGAETGSGVAVSIVKTAAKRDGTVVVLERIEIGSVPITSREFDEKLDALVDLAGRRIAALMERVAA